MGHSGPAEFGPRLSVQTLALVSTSDPVRVGMSAQWCESAVLVVICIVSALTLFRHTLGEMERTWYVSRTFSHCFLIVPLVLYLTWICRKQLAASRPAPTYWAFPVIGALAFVWLMGNLGQVRVIEQFALIGILISLAWGLLGTSTTRVIAFPLALLWFAVPFGLGLIGPLQDGTAWFTVHALTLSGVPAVLENRILSLPSGSWTVAEACSGIRYLFSSVVLGLVYASLVYRSRKRQGLFILGSIVIPLIANGLRAYGIVLLAYLTDNRLAVGVDHIVYGWLFFTLVNLAFFAFGLRWREMSKSKNASLSSMPVLSDAGSALKSGVTRRTLILATGAMALLGLTHFAAGRLWSRETIDSEWTHPPVRVRPPWKSATAFDTSWTPDLRGAADREFVQRYVQQSSQVDLYWALYSGRHRVELADTYNRLAAPKLWSPVADSFDYATLGGQTVKVHRTLIVSGSESRCLWTWYSVAGEITASPMRVKFLQAKARLFGEATNTVVVAVSADEQLDGKKADQVLRDFLDHASFESAVRLVSAKLP
jgi:exosortase A